MTFILEKKLKVGIFIYENVEVLDFCGPFEVFSRTRLTPGLESRQDSNSAPFEVCTISQDQKLVLATGNLKVVPDYSFDNVPELDILLIPGGLGSRTLINDQSILQWIQEQAKQVKFLLSVCTGALLLAKAGLLHKKKATTHWASLDLLQSLDPSIQLIRDQRFVDDGIISSAGISAGIDMAFYVVEKLFGKEVAKETAHYMDYQGNI